MPLLRGIINRVPVGVLCISVCRRGNVAPNSRSSEDTTIGDRGRPNWLRAMSALLVVLATLVSFVGIQVAGEGVAGATAAGELAGGNLGSGPCGQTIANACDS